MAALPDGPDRAETFPELLRGLLAADPGRPLVTAYDDATGERTELSVATYANWVAKTANLLIDEYLLDSGDVVRVALPSHWLVTVFLGAAWSAGLAVTTDAGDESALVVSGPEPLDLAGPQLACALLPFAVRFPTPLPDGVDDYGLLWPGQPDVFTAPQPVLPSTVAWRDRGTTSTQAGLLEAARGNAANVPGTRVLTDLHPASEGGVSSWLPAFARGGSLVLVSNPDEERWPARQRDERATAVLRSSRGSEGPSHPGGTSPSRP
jgi:uncharacterized protein (TIGR03089 family)